MSQLDGSESDVDTKLDEDIRPTIVESARLR